MKTKILFFHFDLGVGGAEKVLVNLVNNLPSDKYDITLCLLFNSGIRLKDIGSHVKLIYLFNRRPFRGVTRILQIFSPRFLYKRAVKERYDVEISYIEGIPARILSGSSNRNSRKFAWVHSDSLRSFKSCFRSINEARKCYSRYEKIAFVSETARRHFIEGLRWEKPTEIVHNVVDTTDIIEKSKEDIPFGLDPDKINLCIVGRLHYHKSHHRLFEALSLISERKWHLYVVGDGELRPQIEEQIQTLGLSDNVTLVGFDRNPYRYMAKMDAIICSSVLEGYSTVATEAMVLGVPFITTDCAGMSDILEDKESGLIVSNDVEGLSDGLHKFLSCRELRAHLREGAIKRGRVFSIENGIHEFEEFLR